MPTGQTVVIPAPKHVCFLRVTALRGLLAAYLPQGWPSPAPEHGRTACPIPAPPPCGARRTAPLVGRSQTPRRWPDGPQSSLPACAGQSRSQQCQSGPPVLHGAGAAPTGWSQPGGRSTGQKTLFLSLQSPHGVQHYLVPGTGHTALRAAWGSTATARLSPARCLATYPLPLASWAGRTVVWQAGQHVRAEAARHRRFCGNAGTQWFGPCPHLCALMSTPGLDMQTHRQPTLPAGPGSWARLKPSPFCPDGF